jgi:uncharacterized membrane protein
MTTQFSSNSESLTDDAVVQDVLVELTTPTSTEFIEQQNKLAWERDRARINDFFHDPSKYIRSYWQRYKPLIITGAILVVGFITLDFLFSVLSFITGIPLIGSLLTLIGLGYSIAFAKENLFDADKRQQLFQKIEQSKQSVIGKTEEVIGDINSLEAKKTVTIQKSPEDLYRFWRNLENLPRFMNHLESVQVLDDKRSHWVAKAPLDQTVEWDAEIIDEKENQSIVWKSLEGAQVDNLGSVTFTDANGSGTKVKVTMKYTPPAGMVGAATATLFGKNAQQQLDEDLERFKQVIETAPI